MGLGGNQADRGLGLWGHGGSGTIKILGVGGGPCRLKNQSPAPKQRRITTHRFHPSVVPENGGRRHSLCGQLHRPQRYLALHHPLKIAERIPCADYSMLAMPRGRSPVPVGNPFRRPLVMLVVSRGHTSRNAGTHPTYWIPLNPEGRSGLGFDSEKWGWRTDRGGGRPYGPPRCR